MARLGKVAGVVKLKTILPLGCAALLLLFVGLIGLAWVTGNIRPMSKEEKLALEKRIESHQPPPFVPPPRV